MNAMAPVSRFAADFRTLSDEGGWIFWALLLLAFGISFALLSIWRTMSWKNSAVLERSQWRRLMREKKPDPALISRLREAVDGAGEGGMKQLEIQFFAKARRRVPFAFVLIGAAPLIGLLGTVSGMMSTFLGMATASQSAPVEVISRGISEALITTETGLIIAVPSFVICSLLQNSLNRRGLAFRRIEAEVLKNKDHGR